MAKMTVTSPEYQSYLAASRTRAAFSGAAAQATAANEARYAQGMGLWDEIIQRYQPGGGYGEGALASYERGKTRAVGAGMQQLVSSGLANTTVAATIGKKYEEEVGTPFKLQLQDVQSQRLSEAQAGKAGFIERRTDAYPSAGLAAQLGQQTGYAQGIQAGGYGGGGEKMPWGSEFSSGTTGGFGGGVSGGGYGGGMITGAIGAPRGGTPYEYKGPDIGRITYQGEPSRAGEFDQPTYGEPGGPAGPPLSAFSPTGTGGEAKVANMTLADFVKMGARNPEEEALFQAWGGMKRAMGRG